MSKARSIGLYLAAGGFVATGRLLARSFRRLGEVASDPHQRAQAAQASYSRDDLVAISLQAKVTCGTWLALALLAAAAAWWSSTTLSMAACSSFAAAALAAAWGQHKRSRIARGLLQGFAVAVVLALALVSSPAGAGQVSGEAVIDTLVGGPKAIVGLGENGMFTTLLGQMNAAVLQVASLLLGYSVYAAVVQTASEGKLLGQRYSSTWAPLRIALIAALLPMPEDSPAKGLSVAQLAVIEVAKLGSSLADDSVSAVAERIRTVPLPVTSFPASKAEPIVKDVLRNAICGELANTQDALVGIGEGRSAKIQIAVVKTADVPNRSTGATTITYSWDAFADKKFGTALCGQISVNIAGGDTGLGKEVRTLIASAHTSALDAIIPHAEKIAKTFAYTYIGQSASQWKDYTPDPGVVGQLVDLYTATVDSKLKEVATTGTAAYRKMIADDVEKFSWLGFGSTYYKISMLNASLITATNATPSSLSPVWTRDYKAKPEAGVIMTIGDEAQTMVRKLTAWFDAASNSVGNAVKSATDWQSFFEVGRILPILVDMSNEDSGQGYATAMIRISTLGHMLITASYGVMAVSYVVPAAGTVAVLAWILGGYLAYVVPAMPYIFFMSAVVAWLALVVEGLIAVPLFTMMHLRMDGEGFARGLETGYFTLLEIGLRPTMLVISTVAAFLVCNISLAIVLFTFTKALSSIVGDNVAGVSALIFGAAILAIVCHSAVNFSFGLVIEIGNRVSAWMEARVQALGQRHDAQHGMTAVAANVSMPLQRAAGQAGHQIGDLLKNGGGQGGGDDNNGAGNDKFFGQKGGASIAPVGNNGSGQAGPSNGKFFK